MEYCSGYIFTKSLKLKAYWAFFKCRSFRNIRHPPVSIITPVKPSIIIHHSSGETITALSFSVQTLQLRTFAQYLPFFCGKKSTSFHMRGASALLLAANKFKTVYPIADSWVAILTPKKQGNWGMGEGEHMTNEKVDPIVTFSKPPTIPPVVGPLVVLSLLEAWSIRDNDE